LDDWKGRSYQKSTDADTVAPVLIHVVPMVAAVAVAVAVLAASAAAAAAAVAMEVVVLAAKVVAAENPNAEKHNVISLVVAAVADDEDDVDAAELAVEVALLVSFRQ
jgi:hypothetical protein